MSNSLWDRITTRLLLIHAVEKQIELLKQNEWKKEIPERCPPILWFGNAETKKHIILTVGANPSRSEYLIDSKKDALKNAHNHDLLNYWETPKNRFRLLSQTERLVNIRENKQLQNEIIDGYNHYFNRLDNRGKHLAYTKWFGLNKSDAYNVEGFLRGFGASYYSDNNLNYQAIHIDLFPFATLSDFNCLVNNNNINMEDLFGNQWATNLIQSLVTMFQPCLLVIFGRANFDYFNRYIDNSINPKLCQRYESASYRIGEATNIGLPFVGLSTNLGNPTGGLNAQFLKQYGQHIRQKLSRSHPNLTQ